MHIITKHTTPTTTKVAAIFPGESQDPFFSVDLLVGVLLLVVLLLLLFVILPPTLADVVATAEVGVAPRVEE